MIERIVAQHVRALYSLTQYYGHIPDLSDEAWCNWEVDWDEATAEELAQQCGKLVAHLTELAGREKPRNMTKEQKAVWDVYLQPFPDHGMDGEALKKIWEKEAIHWELNKEERHLLGQYNAWYDRIAQQRLPWKACSPTDLIWRAKRYIRLVELKAPEAVCTYEAKCLAVEFVLYHCMK